MTEDLVRRRRGRVIIWISEDVAAWNDDELLNKAAELNDLIISLETGAPLPLYPLPTRSLRRRK